MTPWSFLPKIGIRKSREYINTNNNIWIDFIIQFSGNFKALRILSVKIKSFIKVKNSSTITIYWTPEENYISHILIKVSSIYLVINTV